MKNFIFCFILIYLLVSSIAMADETNNRQGNIIIKAGVMVPAKDDTSLLGGGNFTIEGEYVIYSTDYVDFSGIFGYYRTGINTLPLDSGFTGIDTMNSIYYMGGAKFYPVKKNFYIGAFAGGGTTYLNATRTTGQVITKPYSGFALKAGVGVEFDHVVIEASYLVQDSADLVKTLNANKPIFNNNGGVQIMGGYKF